MFKMCTLGWYPTLPMHVQLGILYKKSYPMTNRKLVKLVCQVFVLWPTTSPEWTLKIYADTANGQCNPLFFLLKMLSPKTLKGCPCWLSGRGRNHLSQDVLLEVRIKGDRISGLFHPNGNTHHLWVGEITHRSDHHWNPNWVLTAQ